MKITALTENTSCRPEIGCEHGLSLYIETARHSLLFDTGQTALFAENANRLGIDLKKVDIAVLSHGHYDHGGGLKTFFQINQTAPVYLSQYAFEPHYNGTQKYIGLDTSLRGNPRFIFSGEEHTIDDGLTLFACNTRQTHETVDTANLNVMRHNRLIPEDFRHEQYLLIEENGKRICISGCSHKGIFNILEWFKPDYLIGGFHFMKIERPEILRARAERLNTYDTRYYTCHCTGTEQFAQMKPVTKHLHYLSAGQTITLT